ARTPAGGVAGEARSGGKSRRSHAGGRHTEGPDDFRVARLGEATELVGRDLHTPAGRQPEPTDEAEGDLAAGPLTGPNESALDETREREPLHPPRPAQTTQR